MNSLSYGFSIPRYVAGILYAGLGLFAAVQFVRICWHIKKYKLPSNILVRRRLLCAFGGGASLMRAIWFLIVPQIHAFRLNVLRSWAFMLNILPSVFFVTTYTLLLGLLINLYYTTLNLATPKQIGGVVLSVNIAMFVSMVAMFLIEFLYYPPSLANPRLPEIANATDIVILCVLMVVFFGVSVAFVVYGIGLRRRFGWFPSISSSIKILLKRTAGVALLSTIAFTARSAMLISTMILSDLQVSTWMVLPYYLLCDLLPVSLVLFLLASPPPPPRAPGPKPFAWADSKLPYLVVGREPGIQ